jgi:poly-gamma-glutamate system protein
MKSIRFKNPTHRKVSSLTLFVFFMVLTIGSILTERLSTTRPSPFYTKQLEAANLMRQALGVIRMEKQKRGLPVDLLVDVNDTGIIGDMITAITTTAGDLTAKRTSTNPDFAALMVKLLSQAGVKEKDTIAIGASGSFPALTLATLCAAKTLDLSPLLIYSIGSSAYGGNIPEFTFIEMLECLNRAKVLPHRPIAISLGGEQDKGIGIFGMENRPDFISIAKRSALDIIQEETLAGSMKKRMELYMEKAAEHPILCFVNIGGASANYGNTPASLRLPNGLILSPASQDPTGMDEQGLIFSFLNKRIPVIHLLNIKDLAFSHGIPVDPHPFPSIGTSGVYQVTHNPILILAGTILAGLLVLLMGRFLWDTPPISVSGS